MWQQAIRDYQPKNEQERQDKKVLVELLHQTDHVLTRDNEVIHFSSSPWIVNKTRDKVLMIYHNIYQSWSWCGGHVDGETDFLQVALREGKEETGLQNLVPCSDKIYALDVLQVPRHYKNGKFVNAHLHVNVTYLCEADEQEVLQSKPDENSGVKWIKKDELMEWVNEEDMKTVYQKLLDYEEQV